MKSFFEEFKTFAVRGNAVDLAVAVVVGGAFGAIVSSLVSDIFMPLVQTLTHSVNFGDLSLALPSRGEAPVLLRYGSFLTTLINFFIISFVVFVVVRNMNRFLHKEKEREKTAPPEKSTTETLLEEIRDILKEKPRA
jgi:large conductance mechanosensitive channel